MRCFRLTVALVLTILSSGCSWITVTRPPPRPVDSTQPVQCTTTPAAPIADTAAGLIAIPAGALTAAVGADSFIGRNEPTIWAGIGIVAAGVASLVSAGSGYAWTRECRELQSQQMGCLSGVEESCTALRVEPPPRPSTPGVKR